MEEADKNVSTEEINDIKRLMPGAHAEFSPSKLDQYFLCPYSWQYRDVQEAESEAAREGELLHCGIADMIAGCADPECYSGFSEEQMEMIHDCYVSYLEAKSTFVDPEIGVEERLVLRDGDGSEITWGTADCCGFKGDSGFLIDFKFGRIEVPRPEENLQLLTYATALCQRFHLKTVEMWIVQPRLHKRLHYTFNFDEVGIGVILHVKMIIEGCKKENPRVTPGVSQCRYCAGKSSCPAMRGKFEALQKAEMRSEDLKTLDIGTLAKLYDASQVVSQFIDMIETEFKLRLEQGGDYKGYALKRTSGGFKCPSPAVVFDRLQDVLTPAQMIGVCSCTLTKVKTAYAESAVAQGRFKTKKAAIDALMDTLEDVLIPNADRVSIVHTPEAQ